MKLVIDINLAPAWCDLLRSAGWKAVHWSEVGDPAATDSEIMSWAKRGGWVVLTHDLDFGAILAATGADAPSVLQVRAADVLPAALGPTVVTALRKFEGELSAGALVVVRKNTGRVRILPLSRARSDAEEH